MKIRQIKFIEYYKDFYEFTSIACDTFIKRIQLEGSGVILGCYQKSIPIGISIMSMKNPDSSVIYYINTKKTYRKKGVCKKLLLECINEAKYQGKQYIECDVIVENEYGKVMKYVMEKSNFVECNHFSSYKCICDNETKNKWDAFMDKKGKRIVNYAMDKNFDCRPFRHTSKDAMERFRNDIDTLFPYELSPFSIYNQLIPDLSFLTLKNKIPVSYISARLVNPDPLVVEIAHMAVAKKFQRTCAFSVTLLNFINRAFKNRDSQVVFCVDKNNLKMTRSLNGFLSNIIKTEKNQIVFRKDIQDIEKKVIYSR